MAVRTLKMYFSTDTGKTAVIDLPYASQTLTGAQVGAVMDILITEQPFPSQITAKKGAQIVNVEKTVLIEG